MCHCPLNVIWLPYFNVLLLWELSPSEQGECRCRSNTPFSVNNNLQRYHLTTVENRGGGIMKVPEMCSVQWRLLNVHITFFSPTLAIFRVSGHIKGSCHMITHTWFHCLNLFSQWRSKEQQRRKVYVFRFFLLLN